MFDAVFHRALEVLEPLAPRGTCGVPCVPDALAALRVVRGGLDLLESGVLAGLDAGVAVDTLTASGTSARLALGEDLVAHGRRSSPEEFGRELRRLGDLLTGDGGVARFEQQRRATRLRRGVNADTRMHWLRGELDPETGARLFTAIDGVLESWFHRPDTIAAAAVVAELVDDQEHLAAHALVQLCTRTAAGASGAGAFGVELSILADIETLRHGLHEASICETSSGVPLSPATVRRLACEATILPIVMAGASVPLDAGRSRRLATHPQRRALRAAHRTCVVPGCAVPFDWCQIHHVSDWLELGPTDLALLAPLCHRHHHMAHEGGWTLTLDPQRRATFLPPTPIARAPPAASAG
jgi:hypothetical protein